MKMTNKSPIEFDLDAARVFRAMRVANDDAVRLSLSGVYVEPIKGGGALLIATNGHIMLVQRDRQAVAPRPAILKFMAPEHAPEECECGHFSDGHDWEGGRIRIPKIEGGETKAAGFYWRENSASSFVLVEEIRGEYPPWRKVVGGESVAKPDSKIKGLQGVDSYKLNILTQDYSTFQLHDATPGLPIQITFHSDEDSLGIIMPVGTPNPKFQLNGMLTAIGRDDLIVKGGTA